MQILKKKEVTLEDVISKKGYDPFLLASIQPKGGISPKDDKFLKTGDGQIGCIHVYEYPESVDTHWLAKLMNIESVVTTVDISTEDTNLVKKNLNKSMQEQDQRYKNAKNYEESRDAQARFAELKQMYDEVAGMGEVVKLIHVRIYVAERTWFDLEERIKDILNSLDADGYKAAVFLNEAEAEWKTLYQSYRQQQDQQFVTLGQPLQSEILAAGYPFHYSALFDKYGTLLGFTDCGGPALFDEFTADDNRTFYNAVCIGKMGSGKSTLLKNRVLDRASRGDFVRIFDATGEFTHLVEYLGGKVLKADGSDGCINLLEILKAGETEANSYSRHISKMNIIYRYWKPSVTDDELIEMESALRLLYIKMNILSPEGDVTKPITGLPSKAYPIFSDLVETIDEQIGELTGKSYNAIEEEIALQKIQRLTSIRNVVENKIQNYGAMFNQHTSISNIQDTQVISWDISVIKELDPAIFDSLSYSMLTLCWDNAVVNGTIMKNAFENGEIDYEDIIHYVLIIDESHRMLNAKKQKTVEQVNVFEREARKFFAGIWVASQSIRDYVPEGSSQEGIDAIKTLFELCQYKFVFNQDGNVVPLLKNIFNHQLTQSELDKIPYLEKGETIMVISADKNLQVKVRLTAEENALFKGGV